MQFSNPDIEAHMKALLAYYGLKDSPDSREKVIKNAVMFFGNLKHNVPYLSNL